MRHPDWHARLAAYLARTARTPFAYGRHDCCLFVAGAIKAMTGQDPARGLRGYRSLAGGLRKLRARGHTDYASLVRSHYPETASPRAGDIALIDTPEGPGLGLVHGLLIYAVAARGWGLVPLAQARAFFEVN